MENEEKKFFNDGKLSLEEELLQNKRMIFTQRNIIGPVVSTLYKMAPRHQPRKIDVIVDKLIAAYQEEINKMVKNGNIRSNRDFLRFTLFDAQNWLAKALLNIQEFRDLNLSQNEIDAGIAVDDPNRPEYHITSIYTQDDIYWKRDFIDLDAAIRNINVALYYEKVNDIDCFGCKHEAAKTKVITGETNVLPEICKTCGRLNMIELYSDNYSSVRE